ncbi:MAG: 1-acyl-sn-glycerol-3-phosphate acyltransferase [Bacteroidales bacterium]|nr:1-acyl-sn-glycerol-3-phosphate acyltransferase [Bacteroidales bacterium]
MAKLDLGKPEKFNLLHFYTKFILMTFWLFLWYKKITVVGKKNLKRNTPTILAINHQNTAMDPLSLVGIIARPTIWLARADLYNIKALVPILHSFKILPIFRQRDGLKNLENNDLVFRKIVDLLAKNQIIGLFPEGTHWGFRRLRQTKKAIPRIVELAQKTYDYSLDAEKNPVLNMQIIPVGIYYDDYKKIRSSMFIKFGEPIPMKQYIEALKENPQTAETDIKEAIDAGLRNCMIDIPQMDDSYNTVETMRLVCRKTTMQKFSFAGVPKEREFLADKKTIEIIENEEQKTGTYLSSIKEKVNAFESIFKKSKFTMDIVENNGYDAFHLIWNSLLCIIALPLYICSLILWTIDYFAMKKIATFAKDPLFKNSAMFVGGRFFGIITSLLWVTLWLVFVPLPWWTVFIFWAMRFLIWPVFIDYPRMVKQTVQGIMFNAGLMTKDENIAELCRCQEAVIEEYSKLLQ